MEAARESAAAARLAQSGLASGAVAEVFAPEPELEAEAEAELEAEELAAPKPGYFLLNTDGRTCGDDPGNP